MTKAELIKALEPFDDNTEVTVAAYYSMFSYPISEVSDNLGDILLRTDENEAIPDVHDLREMVSEIYDNGNYKPWRAAKIEELLNEL